jgi:hypothetical protein
MKIMHGPNIDKLKFTIHTGIQTVVRISKIFVALSKPSGIKYWFKRRVCFFIDKGPRAIISGIPVGAWSKA